MFQGPFKQEKIRTQMVLKCVMVLHLQEKRFIRPAGTAKISTLSSNKMWSDQSPKS